MTTTIEATAAEAKTPSFYGGLWRAVPRELFFIFLGMPIAIIGFGLTIGLFSAGVGTIVTFFIGVLVLIVALYVSRGFGNLELLRLEWAGQPPISRPVWNRRPGFWGWLKSMFANGHYWLYLLHTMVVNFVLTVISWTVMITWVSIALGGLTYWFWSIFLPNTDQDWYLSRWFFGPADANFETLDTILYFVLGLVFAATLPFITRGFTLMHYYVAVGLLGSFASDLLRRQVGDLAASRTAAVSAEGHSLRRLERDIHDGPQQRLVRLQMDLAAAERQLDKDPEKARGLINEAMQQSKDALEELRSLSRGFSPPILLDRGLVAALESVADRNTVPTRIDSSLGDTVIPQEVERNAYFVATEGLANAAKHSGATEVVVSLSASDSWLVVSVTDNGAGGAVVTPDHGLAGLDERLRGLGGSIELSSPTGGPTVLAARLPLGATLADA